MLIAILQIIGGGLIGSLIPIFYIRHTRSQEKGKGIQEEAKGKQEEVKVLKEEATAFQEWQKVYKDMVSDNEQFRKNLMDEFKKMEEKLDLYVKQCSVCPNNKIN